MAGATGYRFTFATRGDTQQPQHEPTPLFERIGNDEFAELQHYRQVVDALQGRIEDLERINVDLEYRLEDQARQCMSAEKECMAIRREWTSKCELLQNEIDHWKNEYASEQTKSARLREQNSRTERELYRILQRKYELMRGNLQSRSHQSLAASPDQNLEKDLEDKPQPLNPQQKRLMANLQGFFGL